MTLSAPLVMHQMALLRGAAGAQGLPCEHHPQAIGANKALSSALGAVAPRPQACLLLFRGARPDSATFPARARALTRLSGGLAPRTAWTRPQAVAPSTGPACGARPPGCGGAPPPIRW